MLHWSRAKGPDEVIDYWIDWDKSLDNGDGTSDTIANAVWTVPAGITKDSQNETASRTTIFLSGGTVGATYDFGIVVVTHGGRTFEDTVRLLCKQR